jgi:DNA mismatch endonuclease (patch repair protein)
MLDGCFWHGCEEHGTMPQHNGEWWRDKLAANKARDKRAADALTAADWRVLRFWEHEQLGDVVAAVTAAVREPREG